jgi:putative intracellular protease/amidase
MVQHRGPSKAVASTCAGAASLAPPPTATSRQLCMAFPSVARAFYKLEMHSLETLIMQ